MIDNSVIFLRDEFLAIFSGDEEMVREVLSGFIAYSDELIASISVAFGSGDRKALIFAAHKLKGSAANVRAPELSESAAAFERELMNQAAAPDRAGLLAVESAYGRFRAEICSIYPGIADSQAVSCN